MTRLIFCQKLNQEAQGLASPPYPGELGQRIYNNISAQAWQQWLNHQTMLINEYRLSMLKPEARKFLSDEMMKFLFGDGSDKPAGFVDPSASERSN